MGAPGSEALTTKSERPLSTNASVVSMVAGVKSVLDGSWYSTDAFTEVNNRWLPCPGLLGSGRNCPATKSNCWCWVTPAVPMLW